MEWGMEALKRIRKLYLGEYTHFSRMPPEPWMEHNRGYLPTYCFSPPHSGNQPSTYRGSYPSSHSTISGWPATLFPELQKRSPPYKCGKPMDFDIPLINQHFENGVTAKLVTVGIPQLTVPFWWFWQAKRGQKLAWKECPLKRHSYTACQSYIYGDGISAEFQESEERAMAIRNGRRVRKYPYSVGQE